MSCTYVTENLFQKHFEAKNKLHWICLIQLPEPCALDTIRPTKQGLERETNIFKTAKNDSNGLVRYKNVSRIKSGIVGPSMGRSKYTCVNIDTKRVYPINGYLHMTETDMSSHNSLCMKN